MSISLALNGVPLLRSIDANTVPLRTGALFNVSVPNALEPPMMPLGLTVTAPEMVPGPRSEPELTVTVPEPVAEPVTLLAMSVPALTVVPPAYEFAPVSCRVPVPPLIRPEPLPTVVSKETHRSRCFHFRCSGCECRHPNQSCRKGPSRTLWQCSSSRCSMDDGHIAVDDDFCRCGSVWHQIDFVCD